MKKFLSLLLAAMMLLSCATAMATSVDSIVNGDSSAWADGGDTNVKADIDIYKDITVNYADAAGFDKQGEAATEIWLQVDATGQIDVTVPLILVFQTNIDGGEATAPTTYVIKNNSTADIVVTKIVTHETTEAASTVENPMTLETYDNDLTLAEDKYAAKIDFTGKTVVLGKGAADIYDLKTALSATAYTNPAYEGGLFEVKENGGTTYVPVMMKTGPLSFVTSRTPNGTEESMNQTRGIQLMTIVYTVAIDTSDAIGEAINETMNAANHVITPDTVTNIEKDAND